jgi:tRNA nucleotidyltransferase (CCA-adding enzyme)
MVDSATLKPPMNVEVSSRPDLVERLRVHPVGRRLLELEWAEPTFLVGGSVRDMLLAETPAELDVVVEGDAQGFARHLAESAGMGRPEALHDRFETATLLLGEAGAGEQARRVEGPVRVDVARARTEVYESPGALPLVRPAAIGEDLGRRDFTVNAIALSLAPETPGRLLALAASLEDLEARRLRVLHERSFLDDPTRLLRLARYASRLDFTIAPETDRLARAALAAGALASVSGPRLGADLRLALAEPDPAAAFEALDELGVLGALHPRLRWDGELVARARGLAEAGARETRVSQTAGSAQAVEAVRVDLLVLAATLLPLTLRADGGPRGAEAGGLLDRLGFPAAERDRAVGAAVAAPGLIDVLEGSPSPSALWTALVDVPLEGVALAGAMTRAGEAGPGYGAARLWLDELRLVRLRIDGRDLLAAGVPEGPEIGRRLEAALRLRLDGRVPDEREAQLAAALAAE